MSGLADVVEAVREGVTRINASYPPGLRSQLREHEPEAWVLLEALEDRVNALAREGRFEAALTAVASWEAAWLDAVRQAPVEAEL